MLERGGIKSFEILIEPLLGGIHATKSEIHEAKEQGGLNSILAAAFSQRIFGYFWVVIDPCCDGDKGVGKPIPGAGDPQFLGQFLNSAIPNKVNIKVTNNTHYSSADCNIVAELLFDNLIDP